MDNLKKAKRKVFIYLALTIFGACYDIYFVTNTLQQSQFISDEHPTDLPINFFSALVPIIFILTIIFAVVTIEKTISYFNLKKKGTEQNNIVK